MIINTPHFLHNRHARHGTSAAVLRGSLRRRADQGAAVRQIAVRGGGRPGSGVGMGDSQRHERRAAARAGGHLRGVVHRVPAAERRRGGGEVAGAEPDL